MQLRSALLLAAATLGVLAGLYAQAPFRQYDAADYEDFPLPPDWNAKTEWTRARLKYPSVYGRFRGEDLNWTIDYPRSDRHLLQGIRRLTRIDARSVEQVVQLDSSGEINNWPMLYAVEVGHWALPDDQAAQLREFLLRGGFLMVDDFHGDQPYHNVPSEWQVFLASMRGCFRTGPSSIYRTPTRSFTPSTISTTVSRYPAGSTTTAAGPTKPAKPARWRTGAASTTTKAA